MIVDNSHTGRCQRDTHVAPLGLCSPGESSIYKHVAPPGLNSIDISLRRSEELDAQTMVDRRINETHQTGAVFQPHLPGGESVYLFLEFTIISQKVLDSVRFC